MSLSSYMRLRSAVRRLSPVPGVTYVDHQDGQAFSFRRDRSTRAWVVTQIAAADVESVMSDLNAGESMGVLPTTTYAIGWGVVRRNTSPDLLKMGPDTAEPVPVELERPRLGVKDVWFEMHSGVLHVTDADVLQLAGRIGRAERMSA